MERVVKKYKNKRTNDKNNANARGYQHKKSVFDKHVHKENDAHRDPGKVINAR